MKQQLHVLVYYMTNNIVSQAQVILLYVYGVYECVHVYIYI